ncbi:kielin/chordin-like protein [Dreissena polymorpha]|uniref:kielin/chordin-like protein n=1 Tax=Dreissena polymorpha TaxID=45954 RepID=UPI002263EFF3|nr:kielin/chordin-like protein [Dreissena polymorpha]
MSCLVLESSCREQELRVERTDIPRRLTSAIQLPCDAGCSCQGGLVLCAVLSCPPLRCEIYENFPGQCCPACKTKAMRGEWHDIQRRCIMMPGESVPDNDPCKFCRCDMGDVVCAIADCAPPPCEHPTSIPGKCCPVCNTGKSCNYKGSVYQDGTQL